MIVYLAIRGMPGAIMQRAAEQENDRNADIEMKKILTTGVYLWQKSQ
jgi:hypothetical protein